MSIIDFDQLFIYNMRKKTNDEENKWDPKWEKTQKKHEKKQ